MKKKTVATTKGRHGGSGGGRPPAAGAVSEAVTDQITVQVANVLRLITPWLVVGILPGVGALAHHLWGAAGVAPWAAVGMTITTCGISWLTWKVTHTRQHLGRVHPTGNALLALGWITVVTITGLHRPEVYVWIWGGASLALAWNVRHHIHDGADGDLLSRGWAQLAQRAEIEGASWRTKEIAGPRVRGELELDRGRQTPADVIKARDRVAGAAGVAPTGIRFTPSPTDAGIMEVTVLSEDLLRTTLHWPGPSAPGGSAEDPLVLGGYEDFALLQLVLPGVPDTNKTASHVGVGGMNGAGKSGLALALAAELLTRTDAVLWVADFVKRGQTFGELAGSIDWFATDKGEAAEMLESLLRIVPARADYLGRNGHREWVRGCGIPYLVVILEEAPALLRDFGDQVVDLLQQARSTGVCVIVSAQRWSYDQVPTSVRAQISITAQFGIKDQADGTFLLGDLVDQGADPSQWQNKRPGCLYLIAPDVDELRHTTPGRVFDVDPAALGELGRQFAPVRSPLDDITITAAGPAYANRQHRPEPVGANAGGSSSVPGTAVVLPAPRTRAPGAADRTRPNLTVVDSHSGSRRDQDDRGDDGEQELPAFVPSGIDEDPDVDAEIDGPISCGTGPALTFGSPAKVTPEEARAALDAALQDWAAGGEEFGPRDLYRAVEAIPRKRAWLHGELNRRVADGSVERVAEGRYRARALTSV